MSKKNKQDVVLQETSDHTSEFTDLEVFIKNKRIGQLSQTEGERFVHVELPTGKVGSARSIEDGLEQILADFHLHA